MRAKTYHNVTVTDTISGRHMVVTRTHYRCDTCAYEYFSEVEDPDGKLPQAPELNIHGVIHGCT